MENNNYNNKCNQHVMQIIIFYIILLVDKMNKIELMIFYQTVKKTVKTEMLILRSGCPF